MKPSSLTIGAYPNMMNLFAELNIEDRLQWKQIEKSRYHFQLKLVLQ